MGALKLPPIAIEHATKEIEIRKVERVGQQVLLNECKHSARGKKLRAPSGKVFCFHIGEIGNRDR